MSVIQIAELRRVKAFEQAAQDAIDEGRAVGSPDEAGRPRILASVRPVLPCGGCGLRLPEDHICTKQETSHD